MYSSSSSSSQQQSSSNNQTNPNLIRYDSAPNTHLSNTVDSVVGLGHPHHQFFSESTQSKLSSSGGESSRNNNTLSLLHQGTYGMDTNSSNTTSSGLIRHSSSPAGLLSHLASDLGILFSSLFICLFIFILIKKCSSCGFMFESFFLFPTFGLMVLGGIFITFILATCLTNFGFNFYI